AQLLLLHPPTPHPKLNSFPTRRSSDLNELNLITDKIITTEDPVEYEIDGIIQCPINHEIDLTFAAALRSILRQDPDIILVGEIRSEQHTSELQSPDHLVCRLLLEKKKR